MTKAAWSVLAGMCLLGLLAQSMASYGVVSTSDDLVLYRKIGAHVAAAPSDRLLKSEYPPLGSAVFSVVVRLPLEPFAVAWIVCIFLGIGLAMMYAAYRLEPWDMLGIPGSVLASVVFLGPVLHFARYDIFVLLLLYLAWRSHACGHVRDSGIFITVAGFLKIIPFVWLPLLFFTCPAKDRRSFVRGVIIGSAIGLFVPLVILGPTMMVENILYMILFQGTRGMHVETMWSGLDMLYRASQGSTSVIDFSSGAYVNASVPYGVMVLAFVASLLGILMLWFRSWRSRGATTDAGPLLLLSILWLFAFGSVLSPQYFVWIIPLLLAWGVRDLCVNRSSPVLWSGAFLMIGVFLALATQWIYPEHYGAVLNQDRFLPVLVFNLRNAATVAMVILLMLKLRAGTVGGNHRTPALKKALSR